MTDIVSPLRRAILAKFGLVTEAELALAIDVSTETLRDWRKPGAVPRANPLAWVTLGRKVYYREADVQKWIADNARTQ